MPVVCAQECDTMVIIDWQSKRIPPLNKDIPSCQQKSELSKILLIAYDKTTNGGQKASEDASPNRASCNLDLTLIKGALFWLIWG